MKNLIEKVIFCAQNKKVADKNFTIFAENFYADGKAGDFDDYLSEDLFNATKISFDFFAIKKIGETKVRVSNPQNSHFTFIDIVGDDMPFLIDSTVGYLDKQGLKVRNIIHPIYAVGRKENGELIKISADSAEKNSHQESVIQLHLEKIHAESELKDLEENIHKILANVALMVRDWKPMLALAETAMKQVQDKEIKEFISWIIGGNFIFLGAKEFNFKQADKGKYSLEEVDGGLGVFTSTHQEFRPLVVHLSAEEVCDAVKNPYIIEVLKSRCRSRIHRITNAERIRIQKISVSGEVVGEYRFIGLFTSSAYNCSINQIPLVRNKVAKVIEDSGYAKGGHNYKDLISTLESYPRDELFQISEQDLLKNATGIVAICGRSQVKLFARKDKFSRFVSCLVFTPRDRTNSELRERIKGYLANAYNGEVTDSFVQVTDSNLSRLHVIIRTENKIPVVDERVLEQEITKMTRNWSDDLIEAIKEKFGKEKYVSLLTKYENAFSVSYSNRFDPNRAAIDISRVESCLEKNSVLFNLYKSSGSLPADITELKIYSPEKELILSEIMPVLESFGFNVIQEHTYTLKLQEQKKVWIQYFHLNLNKYGTEFSEEIRKNFEEMVTLIWQGVTQVGFLNRLLVAASLNWKQIYMLRAYAKYLYQTGFRHNNQHIADVLVKNAEIVRLLVKLFEEKFDPKSDHKKIDSLSAQIKDALNQVKDVNDDAVIRRFFGVITATLRTNYYQAFKGYVSFKLDCKKVPNLPLPLPHAEIFVCSPRVEGVHLRGGKVARGGLRWSDRHEDFRVEILGLMKAQMTKNAVIVPVGSKGGFVLKRDLTGFTRDQIQQEGIECYKTFLCGLLDLTDNVVDGKVEHPHDVVRYDEADPYLVVAADKGTATFSDIANSISAKYGFWLGDAFASGGSAGYDHKKMGITAKGGWISVMRHFREMNIDTQSQDFTCAGIGDLAGDVFGNGMLLSKHIKLVAAFNHIHIFLDPNPNAAESFVERQRMFNLARSSWMDYDQSKISAGGGIFERSAKAIKISPEVKAALLIEADELTPTDLMRAILKAPVDLLWNGGIGTYVKATEESHQDVGDRANDALRINGNELRCRVVGEGGNLGFTQKGRIEYALNAGRINTDAMDNSAGVDCSDHEVNIKIALMGIKNIRLDERNKLLEAMTDEVGQLVLADNHLQTQAISIISSQGMNLLGEQSYFIDRLEKSGLLNRAIEFLPSRKEIDKRQNDRISMTRPELCVMLAYAKMDIYNQLLTSDLLNDKYFENELLIYFPKLMQEKFRSDLLNHQLRREIIATQITNFVVNRMGISFINQICHDSGFGVVDVVRNFIIACDSFRIREVWEEVEKLDGKIASHIQMQMFLSANKLLERSVLWLLRNQVKGDVASVVARFQKIADELQASLPGTLAQASKESFEYKIERYRLNNADVKLAARIAAMDPVASAFDIAEIAGSSKFDLTTIAKLYFAVGNRFSLKWLRSKISNIATDSHWQRLASKTILEDIYSYQMRIAKRVLEFNCDDKKLCEVKSVEKWVKNADFLAERFDNFILDLRTQTNPDLAVFVVALNRLKPLVG
ncbi:MAG: NAD-glutamate dehydrogenase [Alphaproteobacteria bacterium]|nr:NAD-glutamate dehydrogenase [Alphaproteobacteria bacterium]